jgi:hypothetical protein
MDISTTKNNIGAAFSVVHKTYANLDKFFKELDDIADKSGYYSLLTSAPRYLRYKSDIDAWGWMVSDFIKLYQKKDDPDTENESTYKNGPIYGLEVNFHSEDGPVINLVKYEYEDMASWTGAIPINAHWQFYWPLYGPDSFEITKDDAGRSVSVPKPNALADEKYRGLRKATWTTHELVGLTQDNIGKLIAGWKEL